MKTIGVHESILILFRKIRVTLLLQLFAIQDIQYEHSFALIRNMFQQRKIWKIREDFYFFLSKRWNSYNIMDALEIVHPC